MVVLKLRNRVLRISRPHTSLHDCYRQDVTDQQVNSYDKQLWLSNNFQGHMKWNFCEGHHSPISLYFLVLYLFFVLDVGGQEYRSSLREPCTHAHYAAWVCCM